ncbi:lamin tail domain-containing protein [Akkermansiaceae bacterium]|nr:lamin tail domain-containing protein [Akkermansiaceae bacterium]
MKKTILFLLLAPFVHAAPLVIGDHSFEGNDLAAGGWSTAVGPEWSGSGFEEFITGFSAEGTDHLGMESGAQVTQDLAATYQANTRYTLTISMGNRPGFTNAGNQTTCRLADNTGTIYVSGAADASPIGAGSFGDAPDLVFDTPSNPASIGKTIRIILEGGGAGRSHFDDIRLDATLLAPSGAALVQNSPASVVTSSTATFHGEVTDIGDDAPMIVIYYGTQDGGTTEGDWDGSVALGGTHASTFSTTVVGLSPNTIYFFSALATNSAGDSWALPAGSFTTLPDPPSVENVTASQITGTTSQVGANVTSTGGDEPEVILYFGTSDGGSDSASWSNSINLGSLSGSTTTFVANLIPSTTYFHRALATNSGGVVWAHSSESFTTAVVNLPAVSLSAASAVGGITAIINGEVTETGNDTPNVIVYYGTSDGGNNPALWESAIDLGLENGTFAELAGGLNPEISYFFTASASNAAGTAWAASTFGFTTTSYTPPTLVINELHFDEDDKTLKREFIELYNASDDDIDLSGYRFTDGISFTFPDSTTLNSGDYLLFAQDPASITSAFGEDSLGPWMGQLKNSGERVVLEDSAGNVIDEVDYQLGFPWPTVGDSPSKSIQLLNSTLGNELGASWRSAAPTPGAINSVQSATLPPAIRKVSFEPIGRVLDRDLTIFPGEDVRITAKVTDPDGVASVTLRYEIVEPGDYIALDDPAFGSDQVVLSMVDDGTGNDALAGDSIYSVTIPSSIQTHRRLIRYTIISADSLSHAITVPYLDDPVPNFAYFVYGGIPDWTGSKRPGVSATANFDFSQIEPVATYHLVTTKQDHSDAQYIPGTTRSGGYGGSDYLWQGALVYEGRVYDHIRYRARGGVWRYAMGKNMWKFDFNRGHRFQARDDFDEKYRSEWNKLNFSSLIQQGNFNQRGEQGLFEGAGFKNHNLSGNPAPNTHYVHFRIIEDANESGPSASQFDDDFQGLYMAIEQLDGQFADEHQLPDGYLWKIEGGNNQGPANGQGAYLESSLPHGDVDDFIAGYGGTPAESWWRDWLDLEEYYAFRANATWEHDYDIHAGKNYFFMHNPVEDNWRVVNWDLDLAWTTTYGGGGTTGPLSADVLGIPALLQEYRNSVRHLQDLLHNEEQQGMLLDEISHWIDTPTIDSIAEADRSMWDYNPILTSSRVNSSKAGHGRYYNNASAPTDSFAGMVSRLKLYVNSRVDFMQSSYLNADESTIPTKPTLSYTGPIGHPSDDLTFASSSFDSSGGDSFAAQEWRIARITLSSDARFDPFDADYDHYAKRHYEIEDDWTGSFSDVSHAVQIPSSVADPGDLVRVRTRMKDASGRWSRWSDPAEFVIGVPDIGNYTDNLMITEMMYDPAPPSGSELAISMDNNDFEFIELKNISTTLTLDLSPISFTAGIDFDLSTGVITSLAPGECVLVVKNIAAFEARYGLGLPVAGVYPNSLSNGGEKIELSYAVNADVHDFTYGTANPWPTGVDGTGFAMILVDPSASPDHALPQSWTSGVSANGTPGEGEPSCETFADWQSSHFSAAQLADPNISGAMADPDGDSFSNLLEYALLSDPFASEGDLIKAIVVTDGGSDFLALQYRRRICRDHLTYIPEISQDLENWGDSNLVEVTATDNGDGSETVTTRSLLSYPDQKEFLRLRIIQ